MLATACGSLVARTCVGDTAGVPVWVAALTWQPKTDDFENGHRFRQKSDSNALAIGRISQTNFVRR